MKFLHSISILAGVLLLTANAVAQISLTPPGAEKPAEAPAEKPAESKPAAKKEPAKAKPPVAAKKPAAPAATPKPEPPPTAPTAAVVVGQARRAEGGLQSGAALYRRTDTAAGPQACRGVASARSGRRQSRSAVRARDFLQGRHWRREGRRKVGAVVTGGFARRQC